MSEDDRLRFSLDPIPWLGFDARPAVRLSDRVSEKNLKIVASTKTFLMKITLVLLSLLAQSLMSVSHAEMN